MSFSLPLSLKNEKSFNVFFNALDNQEVRNAIKQDNNVSLDVKEFAQLLDDQNFLKKSVNLSKRIVDSADSFEAANSLLKDGNLDDLKQEIQDLHSYLNENYPEAVRLLSKYKDLTELPTHINKEEWEKLDKATQQLHNALNNQLLGFTFIVPVTVAIIAAVAVLVVVI